MPIVRVEMLPGRSHAQKAEVIKAMTDVMVNVAKTPFPEAVHVIITETGGDEWGIGGEMLSDKRRARGC